MHRSTFGIIKATLNSLAFSNLDNEEEKSKKYKESKEMILMFNETPLNNTSLKIMG